MTDYIRKYYWLILSVLTAVIAGIGFIAMPPLSDDLGYMMPFRDIILYGTGDWWDSVCHAVDYRYHYDNPRVANMVMTLIAVLPRVIPGIISAIALAYILCAGIRLTSVQHRPLLISLYIASFIVFFPWIDQLYLINFQLNYLWSTALALACVSNWYNHNIKSLWSFLLGAFVSVWHEGFGIPLLITLAALIILYRGMRSRSNFYGLAGLLAGTLYMILSPGFLINTWAYFENRSYILYPFAIPAVLFIITWLAMVIRPSYRKRCLDSHTAALAALSLSGTVMMLLFPTGPRTGALGVTFGCIGSVYLWAAIKRKGRISHIVSLIVSALICALVLAHLTAVGVIAIKINRETAQTLDAYRSAPSAPHFVSMTLREDAPVICMQKPYYDLLAHCGNVNVFNKFYGIDDQPIMAIPKSAIDYKSYAIISGSAMIESRDGILVGPALTDAPDIVSFAVNYGRGESIREFYTVPFDDPVTGQRSAWYHPNFSSVDAIFRRQPIKIDKVD